MNKMKEVAQLLGVELGEAFRIINTSGNELLGKYSFSEKGLFDDDGCIVSLTLISLLTGEYKIKKSILDKVEKEYLDKVIRQFKDKVIKVTKYCGGTKAFVTVCFMDGYVVHCPLFDEGTMFNCMQVGKSYTLKDLGLL